MIRRLLLAVILLVTTVATGFAISKLDSTVPTTGSTIRSMAIYQREERAKINEIIDVIDAADWQMIDSNIEAEVGDKLVVDTTDGAVTVKLPASPSNGSAVWFYDQKGTWDSNNLTIDRNGSKINGAESDFTASIKALFIVALYTGSDWGWSIVVPSVGSDTHNHTAATLPAASETEAGVIEIATSAEVAAGTDNTRAISPAGLAAAGITVDAATTDAAGIVELATNAETQTGSDATKAVTPAGLQSKTASDSAIGLVELATSAETITGSDTTKAVTPAGLQAKVASDSAKGIVELATSAETQTGSDSERAVTPAGLQSKVASTTAIGLVELATDAETQTGTDATRAVTPAGLAATTATTSQAGVVELATTAEALSMADSTKAVTPEGLGTVVGALTGTIPVLGGTTNLVPNANFSAATNCEISNYGSDKIAGTNWTGAEGATQPTGWEVETAGTFNIVGSGQSGDCLKITLTGTSASIYKDVTVDANYEAMLQFYLKNGDATRISVTVSGSGDYVYGFIPLSVETGWTLLRIPLHPRAIDSTVRVTISVVGTAGQYAYVDTMTYNSIYSACGGIGGSLTGWDYSPYGYSILNSHTLPLGFRFIRANVGGIDYPAAGFSVEPRGLAGKQISFGMYVKDATDNNAKVCIDDGTPTCSDAVTADNDWHWAYISKTIATNPLYVKLYVVGDEHESNTIDLNGPVLCVNGVASPYNFYSYNRRLETAQYANIYDSIPRGPLSGSVYPYVVPYAIGGARGGSDAVSYSIRYTLTCTGDGDCSVLFGYRYYTTNVLHCQSGKTCSGGFELTDSKIHFYKSANVSSFIPAISSITTR